MRCNWNECVHVICQLINWIKYSNASDTHTHECILYGIVDRRHSDPYVVHFVCYACKSIVRAVICYSMCWFPNHFHAHIKLLPAIWTTAKQQKRSSQLANNDTSLCMRSLFRTFAACRRDDFLLHSLIFIMTFVRHFRAAQTYQAKKFASVVRVVSFLLLIVVETVALTFHSNFLCAAPGPNRWEQTNGLSNYLFFYSNKGGSRTNCIMCRCWLWFWDSQSLFFVLIAAHTRTMDPVMMVTFFVTLNMVLFCFIASASIQLQ